ncbi:trypsin-like peptidase domain-containing protein [Streptomyces sp. NPDC020192]|uniref:trypsin-like peptidase domain-containing protein n=1 Tax=Streptomyces sp. NPDC020192 TaxID=3365066 RepID=UPI00379534B4
MTRTGERAVTTRLRMPSWIARIEAPDGRVLGAGVLLAPDRVLTAAHVVRPGRRYVVRLVGVPGLGAVPAAVHEDEYVPRSESSGDRSGDLALLRLAAPLPVGHATRLYRLATPHGEVSMYGFPDGDDGGRWHGATLIAARGRDSQVQLRPASPGELAAPGFSGGGVVDHATDRVIGIVLSVDEGPGSAFSYMSPTETIISHLPQVAAWADGAEAVDPRLRTDAQHTSGALDVPFATELASWLRGEGWPVLVTVVPERSDRAWTLNRAVTLADRELRTERNTGVFSHDPPETVPPAGSHDLALDVGGLTAAEVMDRVAARLGIGDDPRPERLGALRVPLAAVLVGVDQAAEPGALLGLLDRLARQGARLLLVFRRQGQRADQAAELLVGRPLHDRWARLHAELDRIVEELGPALDRLRDRVLPGPAARQLVEQAEGGVRRTRMLRAWVAHTPEREREPAHASLLFTFEQAADRRRQRLEQAIGILDARLHRREELLGRVSAEWPLCRQRAAEASGAAGEPLPYGAQEAPGEPLPGTGGPGAPGRPPSPGAPGADTTARGRTGPPSSGDPVMEAYRLYEHALSLLRHTPCDIERAETAVDRFVTFCSDPASSGNPTGTGGSGATTPTGSRPASADAGTAPGRRDAGNRSRPAPADPRRAPAHPDPGNPDAAPGNEPAAHSSSRAPENLAASPRTPRPGEEGAS